MDDLVNPAVLEHARADARVVHVGKRGGCKHTPQEFIERLLVTEARAGRTVVRLKGGDPCIFGRGGEEAATLRAAGIRVDIINGITAGLAAATAAGIPLTHRSACQGVIFVTGHAAGETEPDWSALARSGMTLVIYMGAARAAAIGQALVRGGLKPDTPVAIITHATLPTQQMQNTRLDCLAQQTEGLQIRSPSILVIGEVARHAVAELTGAGLQPQRLRQLA